jgi:hypothetical protein
MKINRRSLLIPWALLIALLIVLMRQAMSYGVMRLAIVITGIAVIAGLTSVREGLIQANLHHGIATGNPALIRRGLVMWWFDAGADALLREYWGDTARQFAAVSINELDHREILPGDMAATADGEHILAYLGEQRWIEADPDLHKVVIESVPTTNAWFYVPIHILRWRQFM